MTTSTLLGLASILVSIIVGLGTYYLSEKRGRHNRWRKAKETVLRDLSKSLGEGSIPPRPVILATIRSVLRSENARNLEAVTLEEVADDLLRQITSDPFLDADRRLELQSKVIELRSTHLAEVQERVSREALEEVQVWSRMVWVSVGSVAAAVGASLIAGGVFSWLFTALNNFYVLMPDFADAVKIPLTGMAVTFLVIFIVQIVKMLVQRRRMPERGD